MGADVNAIVDKIIADAEKKIRTDLKNISSKAKKDFVDKAKEVVLLYYANYSPKLYIRTDNLKNGVIDEDISFSALNGNGYGAWIQFNSNGMSDYEDGTFSADTVVSNFMYGIHGRPRVKIDEAPAITLMNNFQNNYKKTLDGYFLSLGYRVH